MMSPLLAEQAAFTELADHCLTEPCCRRNPTPTCPQATALYRIWRQAWKAVRR
jgi:hypothetical protein